MAADKTRVGTLRSRSSARHMAKVFGVKALSYYLYNNSPDMVMGLLVYSIGFE